MLTKINFSYLFDADDIKAAIAYGLMTDTGGGSIKSKKDIKNVMKEILRCRGLERIHADIHDYSDDWQEYLIKAEKIFNKLYL